MNICITCCPCFPPFPALVFLPLALLFVPLLPQWAYFEPGGLCGPPVLYVLQIDSHIKIIRYKHKRSQTNLHPHSPVLLTNTHLDPHTPSYSDFSGAPWTGESSSPLLQCRSSLWLSKHYSWTLYLSIFSLCFISVDVDDHLLDGLSQKSSFFLPFQGTVRVSGQKEKVQNKNHG